MLIRFTFWILVVPVLLSWAMGPSGVWIPPFMSFARPPGCHESSHLSLDAEKYQSYKEENATINQDTVAQDLKVTARKWRVLNDRKDVQLKPVSVTSSLNVSTKSSTWVSGLLTTLWALAPLSSLGFLSTYCYLLQNNPCVLSSHSLTNPSESLHVRLSRSLSTGFKFPLPTVICCPSPPHLTFCDISPCDWYCFFPRLEVKRWEAGPTPFPNLACRGSQFSSQMSSPMVTDSRHGIPLGISSWNYQKTKKYYFFIFPHINTF